MPRVTRCILRCYQRPSARISTFGTLVVVTATALVSHVPESTARLDVVAAAPTASDTRASTAPVATVAVQQITSSTLAAAQAAPGAPAEMARVPTTTTTGTVVPAEPTQVGPSAARQAPTLDRVAPAPADVAASKNCVVRLHGKGGTGSAATEQRGVTYLAPTGNASGWGGRQWLYFPEAGYQAGLLAVAASIDGAGCTRVILDGFSNGAAFAAKLYCRGESFGGRLARVIVDDPVTDHAVAGCGPAAGVAITLYWTGALEGQAQPGWNCAAADWTCEGGSTIGIASYAAALATTATASPMGGHTPYANPPELTRF